ncbi:monosaccharide ABC transporter membrane protein (CUT2 family) [Lentzea atacamensis]|uniref:Autoinducer 2 import system permease protein LsrD n=1 Tax=Lentzea atacamensis TaxID=531938 RepID=A0A316HE26_9PSEU|nr:ABC transporter permease [Lentzea atacamensis]PWK78637.1 monosaccharide ABC transporter membrane protein (CUT2 family) [Lentzea atacamensis]
MRARPRLADGTGPVLVVLLILLVGLAFAGPAYAEPGGYLALLKRAAPLVVLAVGQYFVIVSGGFDLSVGSLVTAEVVVAARLVNGDDANTWWVIALLLGCGILVGLVNGLITTKLLVPSFIVTLGMLLVLDGAVFLWSGGAPRGALSPSFRLIGRGSVDVPVLGQLPWSVIVLLVVVAAAVWFMRSGTGRTLLAVGDNENVVRLAGGRVDRLRLLAFVLSGLLASVAAILLAGFAGVSAQVGEGLEFRAITAVVLGGVLLGGGRGSVVAAAAGALSLEALFSLLNLLGVSGALESAVQGVIIIAAVAYAAHGAGLWRVLRPHRPVPDTA